MTAMTDSQHMMYEYVRQRLTESGSKREHYEIHHYVEQCTVHCQQQMWSDTSMGWGGMAGQAISHCPVISIICERVRVAIVYISNRYAYACEADDKFYELMKRGRLPGWSGLPETGESSNGITIIHKAQKR